MPSTSPPPPNTKPYLLDVSFRGYIEGLTHTSPNDSSKELCHYFGGIPYALPPVGPFRWRLPRPLPPCYRYGHRANPGRFVGGASLCPQPGFNVPFDEASWDEDCLQTNVWIPAGKRPEKGWPVFFYIHGGFLQFGTPNTNNLTALLSETSCKCIVVMPAYRLNLFGFLASRELQEEAATNSDSSVGNFGFWDQRLALEWTHKNISYFGGDASSITVGGHSAGAHSAFHQLSHDIFLPPSSRLIHRVLLLSNGAGMQPKSISSVQPQFDALLTHLSIPLCLSSSEKLARLRATPPATLLAAAAKISLHEFRACADVSDGAFVRGSLFSDLDSGVYARQLLEAGVQVVLGEVSDEHWVYALWRAPEINSFAALRDRLHADYPPAAIDAVLEREYCPGGALPTRWGRGACGTWREAFGRVYADLQVHAMERGLVHVLQEHGAGGLVRRYRVEWRAGCVEAGGVPEAWGATHGTDVTSVWFWGNGVGGGMAEDVVGDGEDKRGEREVVREFAGPVWEWICGKGWGSGEEWGARGHKEARLLRADGSTGVWQDHLWDSGVKIWHTSRQAMIETSHKDSKL